MRLMPLNPASHQSTAAVIQLLLLAALLGVMAWLIPDHYPPWGSFYNEFAAFAALWVLLLCCAIGAAAEPARLSSGFLIIAGVAAIPLIQGAMGHIHFLGDAWMAAAYVLGFGLACFAGFHLARQEGIVWLAAGIAGVILAGATVSALLVVYQWLELGFLGPGVDSVPRFGRPYGNLAQPNHLATLLCMGAAALIYLHAVRKLPVVAVGMLAGLLIFGLVLTQARAPWVAAALLALAWFFKRGSVPAIKGWAIGLGLAFYAGLIVFWPHGSATPVTPATQQRSDLTQVGTHFQNWEEMLRAAMQEPWWGYGWNQVAVAHVQTAHERHTYAEMLTHSHNLFLDLVIWNGAPIGLAIIAVLLWWVATRAWRCRTPESWFGLMAIGAVGTHAMFEYPLDYAYFLLPVGLLAGLTEADQGTGGTLAIQKPALWPVVAAFAFLMGWTWHEYRIVEADYRLMRFETRRIGPLKAEQPTPDIVLLTQLREDLRMARSLASEDMSADELEWMRRITYRYPWYSSLFRYSVSLALNGRQEEASVEFRRLYDIYGIRPYAEAKAIVHTLADTQYPALKAWQLPPP